MKIKICGIKNVEAAANAVEAGADAVGFVFAASKRKISVNQAKSMAKSIPGNIKKIGVFVNEELSIVENIIQEAGLDLVQLHGDESPEYCRKLSVPYIKAFSIHSEDDFFRIQEYDPMFVLLDSPAGPYRGGNGNTFDWKLVGKLPISTDRIILAGGLDPENIAEAIMSVRPAMVDVSSGVETDGEKDAEKMQSFISHARKAFNQLEER
ncbi:phosphoribosylanthranilate isomerase [Falsibacillus albus]|uniref:N-(5'-phosphoribosyl)anthranilate isomerase n=1 Tax=Falsibacillus albus TaxID=2478915 RepID=A0A3L7K089_9BACI|nr:phosphoribosylanthranilate isomerase [Falsibacillus albus]RLQ95371.1 phosphoribosylanthranilate isomerase [Falsibacillus albus]